MVWNVPGAPTPAARDHDARSMKDQLADLGLPPRIRIDVPITSTEALLNAGEIFRELATNLSINARRGDIPLKMALMQAAWDIKAANRKLQSMHGKTRQD